MSEKVFKASTTGSMCAALVTGILSFGLLMLGFEDFPVRWAIVPGFLGFCIAFSDIMIEELTHK